MSGRFLLTLKNTYSGMFAQYANFGWAPGPDDPAVRRVAEILKKAADDIELAWKGTAGTGGGTGTQES